MLSTPCRVLTGFAAMLALVQGAAAHHFMDGTTPATAAEGLLSGLAHPVIGLDHLLFLAAAATLLAAWRRTPRFALAALFVAGALAGTVAHLRGANLPLPESLVAVTLLGAAGALAFGRALPAVILAVALGLAGGLHGYAYAETVVGAEQTPLAAYLAGFTVVQLALLLGLAESVCAVAPRLGATLRPRVRAGAATLVALGGLAFLGLSLAP